MNNNLLKHSNLLSAKNIIILFALIFFVQMFLLNLLHPLYADDWFYSVIWDYDNTFHSPKVTGIVDILQSQYAHYLGWGGRVVAHILAQFFIMLPPLVFDITNTIVFVFFLFFVYKFANMGHKHNAYLFVVLMPIMWIAQPVFPSTTIWLTGSCNYLWCTFIVVIFLYQYCKLYWLNSIQTHTASKTILFVLFGIVAGWTNENISVSILFFLVCLLIMLRIEKRKIPSWTISGFVGAIIGCVFLLLAPGNRARNNLTLQELGESKLSMMDAFEERLSMLWNAYTQYVLLLTILFVALLLYKYFLEGHKEKRFYIIPILLVITAHVAFVAMIAAPIFPPRATFGINTFMILAISILYANINLKYKILKLANLVVILLLFSYYIYSYLIIYERLGAMNKIWTAREKIIEESKAKGIYDINFDDLYISHKRLDVYDLDHDSTKWQNRSYSTYYEINSVKRKSTDDYKLGIYPQE